MFDESKIVLQFAAVSDLQHGFLSKESLLRKRSPGEQHLSYLSKNLGWFDTGERGREGFRQLQELALKYTDRGLDAVFFAGDIVNNARASQVESFKEVYEDVLDPVKTPFIFCLGNHDIYSGRPYTYQHLNLDVFYRIFGDAYRTYDVENTDLEMGYVHQVVGDYHFIAVNPMDTGYISEVGDPSGAHYAPELLKWLDELLAKITTEHPNRYVFLTTHPMLRGLAYGGDLVLGTLFWNTKELLDVLNKYPQVVAFGGHLHFPISDERSIMQDKVTNINCGAMSYMATENGGFRDMLSVTVMKDASNVSNGHLVQIDEAGNLRIIRMNFGLGKTIKEPWILPAPSADGAHLQCYSWARGNAENNQPPVLAEDAIMVADNAARICEGAVKPTLAFKAGTDDDLIHYYKITITEGDQVVEEAKLLADSYLHASPADMKTLWTLELAENTYFKGHTYTISLAAYDSWEAESNIVTYTYQP